MTIDYTNFDNDAVCYDGYEQDSGTPPVVQEPSRYLIGFSSPLSGLCVRFAEPLYGIHVCICCGALRPRVKILPCAHMLCLSCIDKHLIKTPGGDGSETQVWCSRHRKLRPASRLRSAKLLVELVRLHIACCPNSEHGCPFKAELGQVEEHYDTCPYRAPASPSVR